jgi:uncharacterized protein with von Willebrand factor type A (vWA) domain
LNKLSVDDAYQAYLDNKSDEIETSIVKATGNFIFLLDRSGSM